jgi:phospholipid transport system substrate-binding protein
MKIIVRAWLSSLLALGLLAGAANAQSPNAVIEEAAKELDSSLQGRRDELRNNKQELYELIDKILLPRFDRTYAAQLVLGQNWKTATADERTRFIDVFYTSLLHKYADGVLEFDPGRIEILPFRGDESKPRVTVKTTVRLDDGTKVPVDYNLVKRSAGWMLFDVSIEGISYIRNFRVEIGSEIQATSLDAVIDRLARDAATASAE